MYTMSLSLLVSLAALLGDPLAEVEKMMDTKPDEAKTQLLAAVDEPETEARANYLLCVLANRQGDLQDAVDYGEKAAQMSPEDSQVQYQYAVAMRQMFAKNPMFAMTNLQTYKDTLDKAIELDRHNYNAWNEKIGFLMNAPPMAGGSLAKAKEVLAEFSEVDETQSLFMTAAIHAKEGEHDKALQAYQRVVENDPDNTQARMAMGYTLINLNRHKEAATHFENMAEGGKHLPALYQAGRARVLGNMELEQAVSLFDRYIAAGGTNQGMLSAAHWRKGMALESLDRKDEAMAAYKEAVAINPDNKNAAQALKKLEADSP